MSILFLHFILTYEKTYLICLIFTYFYLLYSERCKLKLIESDTVEGPSKIAKLEAVNRGSGTKPSLSLSENSKTKLPVSSSSSAPSSYLTLKSHLLLMNAPSTSKPNRYKRSHSSISNPESRIKEVVEKDKISTEKSSKSDNSKGKFRIYLTNITALCCLSIFTITLYIHHFDR